MRVLLVESDAKTAAAVELMLQAEGFNVYVTDLGEDAVDIVKIDDYDAIVTEISLPDISGFDVIRRIRASKVESPVVVVSGFCGLQERVKALRLGADDFLSKPFHQDELVARLHAVVRRSRGHTQSIITIDGLSVNLDTKTASLNGQSVPLTGKEYGMVELLALRKGCVVTKEMFLNHLYGGMDEPELKIIDVFICKLRRKLAAKTDRNLIETIWGRGYMMRPLADAACAA